MTNKLSAFTIAARDQETRRTADMSPEKVAHFKMVSDKARKIEQFIIDEAAALGINLSNDEAARFREIVIKAYGDNTPPAPVDPDENIGSRPNEYPYNVKP